MQQLIRLFSAVEHGRVDEVRAWLRSGVAVDAPHPVTGFTPLMLAAKMGKPAMVSLLLQAGAAVDGEHHSDRFTALMLAADKGNSATVQVLLRGGAVVDKPHPDSYLTALFLACKNGHADTARVLLKGGAMIDALIPGVGSPLIAAALMGHAEVVNVLLEGGAAIDAHSPTDGFTALLHAIDQQRVGVVQALLQGGAAVEKVHRDDGSTPLMRAAMTGNAEMVQMLLKHGAAVNAKFCEGYANEGLTALVLAVEMGHVAAARALLQGAAAVDATYPQTGTTLLMMAVHRGLWDVTKLLLEFGADPYLANHDDISAVMLVLTRARSLNDTAEAQEVLRLMLTPKEDPIDHGAPAQEILSAVQSLSEEGGARDDSMEASILDGSVGWSIGAAAMEAGQQPAHEDDFDDASMPTLTGQFMPEEVHLVHAF